LNPAPPVGGLGGQEPGTSFQMALVINERIPLVFPSPNHDSYAFNERQQNSASEKFFATHRMAWGHPMGTGHSVGRNGNKELEDGSRKS